MKGLILCLVVIVTVDAVRSQAQGYPPTRTKKGKRPSRNDNPDVGLPSGADVPDGRRRPAGGKALPVRRPAPKPAYAGRPAVVVPPVANRLVKPSRVKTGPPPPGRRPAGRYDNTDRGLPSGKDVPDNRRTRTKYGPPPPARGAPAPGRRNDNPDYGLLSGRDYPDRGFFPYAAPAPAPAPVPVPPPVAPAPVAPAYACDYYCQFDGYKPVCTTYGNEYDNDCYRQCRNEPRDCENACPCNAAGPAPVVPGAQYAGPCDYCYAEENSPVCVDNEENVYNECFARCEGKTVTCTDVCPCY